MVGIEPTQAVPADLQSTPTLQLWRISIPTTKTFITIALFLVEIVGIEPIANHSTIKATDLQSIVENNLRKTYLYNLILVDAVGFEPTQT